jgi:hypothetical protein
VQGSERLGAQPIKQSFAEWAAVFVECPQLPFYIMFMVYTLFREGNVLY